MKTKLRSIVPWSIMSIVLLFLITGVNAVDIEHNLLVASIDVPVDITQIKYNLLEHCLAEDKTNENDYILYEYMCGHFSEDTCYGVNSCFRKYDRNNTLDLTLYPCVVRKPGAHAVTAIKINSTWYIIEPQTDEIHELSVYRTFYKTIFVGKRFVHFCGGSEIRGVFVTLNA